MSVQEPSVVSELVADMEDWSLQAIVRESSGDFGKNFADMNMDDQGSYFDSWAAHDDHQFDHDFLAGFPDIFEVSTGSSEELEELYKPFYPTTRSAVEIQQQLQENVVQDKPPHDLSPGTSSVASVTAAYTPKYKKRKNQHKRVVIQVSAEGLSSDMWAWRKYGQKPIKGSPYPRSYYRCSSSKGCLARKQVEQSCRDPGMFIVTYSAEHSHSQPTRRNSLAGTVRQKFPSPKTQNTRNIKQEKTQKSTSPISTKTDVVSSMRIKEEVKKEKETQAEGERYDDNDSIMSDFVFNSDFFAGLEDFDDFITQVPSTHASAQKFPLRSL